TTVNQDGLYRTDDGGRHWTRLLEGEVRAVAVDPSDERVVYAGTEPVRLYRSEDGGDSWEELTALPAMPEEVRQKWWTPYPPATVPRAAGSVPSRGSRATTRTTGCSCRRPAPARRLPC